MDPEKRRDDPDDTPAEVEQGLAYAYGRNDAGSSSAQDRRPEVGTPDPAPSVLDRIAPIAGGRPTVSLRDPDLAGGTPMLKPPGPDDHPLRAGGKYTIHGLLGRGGVGVVHRGHDMDLGRDIAMKFLQEKFKDEPVVLRHFVEEAQIGGQLQHPGIVPVYDLGMKDGRPFFTMKLVKGKTLAQLLSDRGSPAQDRRRLLAIFEQVCQTMAYAHARGVVHRDLKPANIMIGAFGEVQVVDWGMGKVLDRGGVADQERATERQTKPSVIETIRSSGRGTESIMGSVMGTPAYMPPEQATGDIGRMDERSDVFALGAILCEVLTAKPPYVGEQDELIGVAAAARLDDAHRRLDSCGADTDLVELTKWCLTPAPAARPKSAQVLANRIRDYLAQAEAKIHEARVAAAEERVRASAARTRQKLAFGLVGVVALGFAASLWFWRQADEQRALAERSAQDAQAAETLAREAQGREAMARKTAETNLANFDRLSHVVRLETARAGETTLYPPWPHRAGAMRAWLDDSENLRDALPELRATIAALESQPLTQAEADHFLHGTLRELVADIEAFEATEVRDVEQRLLWAESVEELTVARYPDRWNEARLAILRADGVTASRLYGTSPFELRPQMGLVPIGMNPDSKLWEFYHLRSGWAPGPDRDPAKLPIPEYGEDGRLEMTGRGIVFVLIPGGSFFMGAQESDPDGRNYDPGAASGERPVHEVELAPYFLSKYELTQGQWARLTGGEYPSWYRLGRRYTGVPVLIGDEHPVEQVSWTMCDELLRRHGLLLPTEAQWERGCRGGTSTPWSTGDTPGSLEGFANVLDRTGQIVPPVWPGGEVFDDHFKGPAPVGTYQPNRYGLHDVHGNLWEWCRDWSCAYTVPARPGDGLREPEPSGDRIGRGGSGRHAALHARSACRSHNPPAVRNISMGVRPVRQIQP